MGEFEIEITGVVTYVEGGDDAGGVAGLEFDGGAEVSGSERAEGFEAAASEAIEPNGECILVQALVLRAPEVAKASVEFHGVEAGARPVAGGGGAVVCGGGGGGGVEEEEEEEEEEGHRSGGGRRRCRW